MMFQCCNTHIPRLKVQSTVKSILKLSLNSIVVVIISSRSGIGSPTVSLMNTEINLGPYPPITNSVDIMCRL